MIIRVSKPNLSPDIELVLDVNTEIYQINIADKIQVLVPLTLCIAPLHYPVG